MKAENIEEFEALIIRYLSVTLKEIDKRIKEGLPFQKDTRETIANALTGFGCHATCTLLCENINCMNCIYNTIESIKKDVGQCYKTVNELTYDQIMNAKDRKELKAAFRVRAEHMKSILKQLS